MHNFRKEKTISELRKLIKTVSQFRKTVNNNINHNRYYDWSSSSEEGLLKRLNLQMKEVAKQPLLEAIYLFKIKILDRLISVVIKGRLVWFDGGGISPLNTNIWSIKKPFTITGKENVYSPKEDL